MKVPLTQIRFLYRARDQFGRQVRQLERYYRFHPGAQARRILGTIQDCAIAWEENRCNAFTAGLLEIAARLRRATDVAPAER